MNGKTIAPAKKFNLKTKIKPILKITGVAVLAIIAVYIVFAFIGPLFFSSGVLPALKTVTNYGYSQSAVAPAPSYSASYDAKMMSSAVPGMGIMTNMAMPQFSSRNAESAGGIGGGGYYGGTMSTGDTAEEFEITQYNAQIETRQTDKACAAIAGLKARQDVIFESAGDYRRGCNYSFKVVRDKADEILNFLKGFKPKELTNSTYTIQQQVQDYTSEIDILQKKLAVIDDTMSNAVSAYDEVAGLATKTKDVENLAKVINSKISTIQQLTQERLSVNARLENIQRTKAQQLDRLNYAYFYVTVADNSFIDAQTIKDSWIFAVKNAMSRTNETIQNISINLLALLFVLLQYAIYALVLLLTVKYGWKIGRSIWKK